MQELKPCPFCGGPGRIVQAHIYVDGQMDDVFFEDYRAECPQCGGNTGKVYRSRFVRRNGEFIFERDGYAEAIEGWNCRAETLPGGSAPGDENTEGGEGND